MDTWSVQPWLGGAVQTTSARSGDATGKACALVDREKASLLSNSCITVTSQIIGPSTNAQSNEVLPTFR